MNKSNEKWNHSQSECSRLSCAGHLGVYEKTEQELEKTGKSCLLAGIPTGHIDPKYSLDSDLHFQSMSSVRIRSSLKVTEL